jgi:hypothetical protein
MPFYLFGVRPWVKVKDLKDINNLMSEKARKIHALPQVAATLKKKTSRRNSFSSGWLSKSLPQKQVVAAQPQRRSSLPPDLLLVHLQGNAIVPQPEISETQTFDGTDPDLDHSLVQHHRRTVLPPTRRSLDNTDPTTQEEEGESSLEFSLPPPPRSSLKVKTLQESLASTSTLLLTPSPQRPGRHIHWGVVQFRVYSLCLGDNPSCSDGAPIQLDWSYKRYKAITVWEFERIRGPPRLQRHSSTVRHAVLLHEGYSLQEILAATDRKEHDQRLRKQTLQRYMAFDQRVEQLWNLLPWIHPIPVRA